MTRLTLAATAAAVLASGCARAPAPPRPSAALRTVAIVPPVNLTGDELVVQGGSVLEKYVFDTPRVTVPDVLAVEARRQLEARGVTVLAADAVAGSAPELHLEVRRWEPDAPFKPNYIIVSLAASVVAPDTHRILWSAEYPSRPVATPGAVSLANADLIAAPRVMTDLFSEFGATAAAR